MHQPLISVIIPVYNVESYIDECLQSVVLQTYKNLEIILVDDGSTDTSGEKCDEWCKKDERICVIHKKNGGLSDARNAGLKKASGEYISFLDSDDIVHTEMYQTLYNLIKDTGCKISCCNVKQDISFTNFQHTVLDNKRIQKYTSQEALFAMLDGNTVFVTVWNKLYAKDILEDIFFEYGKCHEDEFWTYQIIGRAKEIVFIDEYLYGYRQRENSIMHRAYSLRNLDRIDAKIQRLAYLEKHFPELVSFARCDLRFECIGAMQRSLLYLSGDTKKQAKKKILKMVHKYSLHYQDYKALPIGRQIWCLGSNICFMGTCIIRNIFHYGP